MESGEIKDKPVGVTRMGEKMVFWRDGTGQVNCLRDMCAHRGVALSEGQIHEGRLQCPFHGFEYDATGQVVVIPALGRNQPVPKAFRVQSYPTYEEHGFVWVWWGEQPSQHLEPPAFFDDLDRDFSYASIRDPWDAHYSRVIENQLDVVHLPFLHRNSIGRGGRTVVDGPGVEWLDDQRFRVYTYNRVDDGTPPRKPSEVPVPRPDVDLHLEFIFPNLWQNHISPDVRVIAAFVPVDANHSLLYLRFYQKFLRLPLLRSVIAWLAMPFNRFVAHQDRRVVVTHRVAASGLRIGEKLIQGDRPIVEYRRRREQLIDRAVRGAAVGSQDDLPEVTDGE
jgi:phenylpropionate dioxygenase-like ring-hydroxylating dioxygenase large terminal subunit